MSTTTSSIEPPPTDMSYNEKPSSVRFAPETKSLQNHNTGMDGIRNSSNSARNISSSSTTQNDTNSVQILVCSGNLGNAAPDETSWNHWVPIDGYYYSDISSFKSSNNFTVNQRDTTTKSSPAMKYPLRRMIYDDSNSKVDVYNPEMNYQNTYAHINLTQMNIKEGLRRFGENGNDTMHEELRQNTEK